MFLFCVFGLFLFLDNGSMFFRFEFVLFGGLFLDFFRDFIYFSLFWGIVGVFWFLDKLRIFFDDCGCFVLVKLDILSLGYERLDFIRDKFFDDFVVDELRLILLRRFVRYFIFLVSVGIWLEIFWFIWLLFDLDVEFGCEFNDDCDFIKLIFFFFCVIDFSF